MPENRHAIMPNELLDRIRSSADGAIEISVRELPPIERLFDASIPIVWEYHDPIDSDAPTYPRLHDSGFWAIHRGHLMVVTAGHCIPTDEDTDSTTLALPTSFSRFSYVTNGPVHTTRAPHLEDSDRADLAAIDVGNPVLGKDIAPIDLHETRLADTTKFRAHSLFAICGYPLERFAPNYDTNHLHCSNVFYIAQYERKTQAAGMHTLRFSAPESLSGVSGSLVIKISWDNVGWYGEVAGIALRGGNQSLHFLDIRQVLNTLIVVSNKRAEIYQSP